MAWMTGVGRGTDEIRAARYPQRSIMSSAAHLSVTDQSFQVRRIESSKFTDPQISQLEISHSNAHQFEHRMADRFAHTPYLPIFPFGNCQLQPGVLLVGADLTHGGWAARFTAANVQPIGESEILVLGDHTCDLGIIGLGHL